MAEVSDHPEALESCITDVQLLCSLMFREYAKDNALCDSSEPLCKLGVLANSWSAVLFALLPYSLHTCTHQITIHQEKLVQKGEVFNYCKSA
jgi:hypothetical protein